MPANNAKAVMREATRHWLQDKENVDELLERLAEGERLRPICDGLQLVYSTVMRYLVRHHNDEYEAAKEVRADSALDEIAEIEDDLETDPDMDFNTARELIKSKQWRAERLNPRRYSPKQTVDMNVTDKTALHLEAVRQLARVQVQPPAPAPAISHQAQAQPQLTGQPVHIGQETVVDAAYTEVDRTTVTTTVGE